MSGTHGREKMCALIQYAFEVYHKGMCTSEELWNRQHWSADAAHKVSVNVSKSRKMLKFLQFMEVLKKAYLFSINNHDKPIGRKVLEQVRNISSFFFYLSDNIVWLTNTGIFFSHYPNQSTDFKTAQSLLIEQSYQKLPWNAIKDFFAVIKNISGLIKSILSIRKRRQKMSEL
jgi:hypothetical protein